MKAIEKFPVHCLAISFLLTFGVANLQAQVPPPPPTVPSDAEATSEKEASDKDAALAAPAQVEVAPQANDQQIQERILQILNATEWYTNETVKVDQGVVFLNGTALREEQKKWAGDLARSTRDVVAVVNRMNVSEKPLWDLSPAWNELRGLNRSMIQSLPMLVIAAVIAAIAWFVSGYAFHWSKVAFNYRFKSSLLADVAGRAVAIAVLIVGLYLALRVTGLTQIAATLLGGTGLIGLVIGIAFRDIAENFLASVLISVQRPFALGDTIDVDGHQGLVQSVTMRGTLLMTPEGNHVQIPNSVVYKSTIRNMTANPNQRQSIDVTIRYSDSISKAQDAIISVLQEHEGVLQKPEPMVLADSFGPQRVVLRVYIWVDGSKHNGLKVKSSLLRQVKTALVEAGISMPDDAREIILPKQIPISILQGENNNSYPKNGQSKQAGSQPRFNQSDREEIAQNNDVESTECTTEAEGDLATDANLEEQASLSRKPDEGTNLLANDSEHEKKLQSSSKASVD
jgi:small-conductance mechanosensitive channel